MPERLAGGSRWDGPGPDFCDFCRHSFHVEVGFHCIDCDRPVCPACVMTVTVEERHRARCPECIPETER